MKAVVFSIGEKTTDLCCELMAKYGFEVVRLEDPKTTLWQKLKQFYELAMDTDEDVFVRMDADIIPNANVKTMPLYKPEYPLWECSVGFDWYKQDRGTISIHYMNRRAIQKCLEHVDEAKRETRPETYLWRVPNINLYTTVDWTINRGIHGYGQIDQRERIKELKDLRGQQYDWGLVERIEAL